MQNTAKMERKHGQKAASTCCMEWSLVLKAAAQNYGITLAECGMPIWDMSAFEAAGMEEEDGADFEIRFCPFCGQSKRGVARALPVLPQDRPLNMAEALAYLRMDHLKYPEKQISRFVAAGQLKALRRGRVMLFERKDLDGFLLIHRGR